MTHDWVYNVSSFLPDRLSTLGPREAAAIRPLMTARGLELLSELGIPLLPSEAEDAVEQSRHPLPHQGTVIQRPETSAMDGVVKDPTQNGDLLPQAQALTVVEALFYLQWANLDWPQTDLDALLSWWGGDVARRHRLRLRPRGLDRVYFGRAASGRAKRRLKQLLQESDLGTAVIGS